VAVIGGLTLQNASITEINHTPPFKLHPLNIRHPTPSPTSIPASILMHLNPLKKPIKIPTPRPHPLRQLLNQSLINLKSLGIIRANDVISDSEFIAAKEKLLL